MRARPLAFRSALAVLLAFGLSSTVAPPTLAGGSGARVCEPPRACLKACRSEAHRAKADCAESGASRKECRERANAQRTACVADRCAPNRSCEARCEMRAKALLHRCIRDDMPLEQCKEEANGAAEACIAECPQPCVCPEIYAPVCGVDGDTYGNACEARCAGAEIEHEGPCEPQCEPVVCDLFCPDGYATGSDGCEICECADACICPDVYAPVCGVDGHDYGNACQARCAGVELAHEGECEKKCRSNDDCRGDLICYPPDHTCRPECHIACLVYDPVCGEDGVTYGCGAPDAYCHGVEVAHDGECRPACRSNEDCTNGEVCNPSTHTCGAACEVECFAYDPVCGEDGNTYACGEADAHCHGVAVDYPGECGVCYGDQDCKEGLRCNAAQICLPPPGCDQPGMMCPAVCTGHCVPWRSPPDPEAVDLSGP